MWVSKVATGDGEVMYRCGFCLKMHETESEAQRCCKEEWDASVRGWTEEGGPTC